jgi:cytoskeletal protein CcmA (bactofilin family)
MEEARSMANPLADELTINNITSYQTIMLDTQNKNYLSNDAVIKGSIKFANEFIFDGNMEGDITSEEGILTVGENANVRGDVKSRIVIVKGKVHGNITVPERCELHAGSQLIGDLKAVRVALHDGATFLGQLEVAPNKAAIKDVAVAQNREPQKIGARR